jgi:hypothetical protein
MHVASHNKFIGALAVGIFAAYTISAPQVLLETDLRFTRHRTLTNVSLGYANWIPCPEKHGSRP